MEDISKLFLLYWLHEEPFSPTQILDDGLRKVGYLEYPHHHHMLEEGKWISLCQKSAGFWARGHKLLGIGSAGPEHSQQTGKSVLSSDIAHLLQRNLQKIQAREEQWK